MQKGPQNEIQEIRKAFSPFKSQVIRRAQGVLKHNYLVPGGYYEEQWDWDGFFMGIALASENPAEAIYLKNWALNYIELAQKNGYSPACVTPNGPETGHRAMLMKPIIAQGTYLSSKFLDDFDWIKKHYPMLKTMVLYRQNYVWSKKYDLGVWTNSMESGADDNVAAMNFPDKTVVAVDVNTFIYREYFCLHKIAQKLGNKNDADYFLNRAEEIKENINQYLWNKEDGSYYNLNLKTDKHVKRISYSNFAVLWAEIAPENRAVNMIRTYLISPKYLWTKYGIRSLAKTDLEYNNINRIKPHSNWQGPIWPIANFLYMQGLLNYGFAQKAIEVAKNISKLCIDDIKKTGGMHENYDAETGKPLAAPNFISWNLLVSSMLEEAVTNSNPLAL